MKIVYSGVGLRSNGAYWHAVWYADNPDDEKRESIGSKKKLTKTAAKCVCNELWRAYLGGDTTVQPKAKGGTTATLDAWLDGYEADYERQQLAPRTLSLIACTCKLLREHFGEGFQLHALSVAAAKGWRDWLATRPGRKGAELSDAAVCGHIRRAKHIFRTLPSKPFASLRGAAHKRLKNWTVLRHEQVSQLIDRTKADDWKALFALCAYAGARLGEALMIEWPAIDFKRKRITMPEPKDARGKRDATTVYPTRQVPLTPELAKVLTEIRARRGGKPEGPIAPVPRNNLHRDAVGAVDEEGEVLYQGLIRAAGLEPWDYPYHTLRRYRATWWLIAGHKPHVVAEWMGHTLEVMMEFYSAIPAELYDEASNPSDRIMQLEAELARLKSA